jgi:RNA 3'-terminal phosphate cyclase (ATP)
MTQPIVIDGSVGEGGGQILRSALALSLVTGQPFRIDRIRAGRKKPGLLRQHLTAVQAAAAIGGARVQGDAIGSQSLSFEPDAVRAGEYRFSVGTAGSATLVAQTILPGLLQAKERSRLTLEGGTHNPSAPPFDFLEKTFVPIVRRMGASIELRLEAHGFYPAGGGRFTVDIEPCERLDRIVLTKRSAPRVHARALVASLSAKIAHRELGIAMTRLGLERADCWTVNVHDSVGPGNVLMIVIDSDDVTEVVTGFGLKNVTAEKVASDACDEAEAYLSAEVPIGAHLADQLLIPMALARGGEFRTLAPTPHMRTNADVIQKFLDVAIGIEQESDRAYRVIVSTK